MEKTTHIAVISGPGFSHLFPILEFSKRLVHLHPDLHITSIIPTLGSLPSVSKTFLKTLPPSITLSFLPPVDPHDLPHGLETGVQMQLTVTYSLPFIQNVLKSLNSRTPLVALVVDNFAYEALDFAKEFNLLSYIYFPKSAFTLSMYFHLPKLDKDTSCEFRDLLEPIQMPGCVPIQGHDLHYQIQDRSSQGYKLFLERVKRFCFVDGIFINSFIEMEEGPIRALTKEGNGNPPIYPIGPVTEIGVRHNNEPNVFECLSWLDKQAPKSVLYVSFGSGGTLSQVQITELALGLELSNHKFLWVARAPSNSASSAYLSAQNENPFNFLPYGFLERTKGQGLVIPSWAPQIKILSHSSIGGFLSHCGWNSTLESVLQGVPLIAWPLFAEQRMNAVMLSDGLKVALRANINGNGLVQKEEVARVIKSLMDVEGEKMRKVMKGLKEAATDALKEDGCSSKSLYQSTARWKSINRNI
ncbi:hydroquinone glucosyltransferase-like [Abrus precatorius]|uniref:Glycosyltransferase n=1 Tax=Abrus precatorius TaxID=3816 RepID=A0A8B8K2A7_ABRPR|nr:hydroquinone glucosyltransferase-like [Abrus precatorius]